MNHTLLTPTQWAQTEFGLAELGDQRRTQRLMDISASLARSPGGTLPQAFPAWKDLKAAYRFFAEPKITRPAIMAPHFARTRAEMTVPGEYLLIEDTTGLDYSSHPMTHDLGSIGNGQGRGFWLHSTLTFRVAAWDLNQRPEGMVVGLLAQQCWRRRSPLKKKRETWRQRTSRTRESQRWAAAVDECGAPPAHCQWIFIADREADFYEPIGHCQRWGTDFIIRGFRDRVLSNSPEREHLTAAVARMPRRGQMTLALRARPGQAARTATLQVRSGTLTLQGPERQGQPQRAFTVNVVDVQEVAAPPGVEPLHWRLLTSLPCTRWVEVQRIVQRYTMRWRIEDYHKALKTGAGAEESQLEEGYRIETLLGVLALVAVRLLNLQHLAQAHPDAPVAPQIFGPEALALLGLICGVPVTGWTHHKLMVAIARLGGFPARKSDGLPGWQRIWRGWQRLLWMSLGAETFATRPLRGRARTPTAAATGLDFFNLGGKRCG